LTRAMVVGAAGLTMLNAVLVVQRFATRHDHGPSTTLPSKRLQSQSDDGSTPPRKVDTNGRGSVPRFVASGSRSAQLVCGPELVKVQRELSALRRLAVGSLPLPDRFGSASAPSPELENRLAAYLSSAGVALHNRAPECRGTLCRFPLSGIAEGNHLRHDDWLTANAHPHTVAEEGGKQVLYADFPDPSMDGYRFLETTWDAFVQEFGPESCLDGPKPTPKVVVILALMEGPEDGALRLEAHPYAPSIDDRTARCIADKFSTFAATLEISEHLLPARVERFVSRAQRR
jgi:hypothetical protein